MGDWAGTLSKYLRVLRLDSFRNKILVFAVLGALIPSGAIAWYSYSENRRALADKINQELLSASGQTARELGVWLKERLYDLRVFASSYEVSESLDRPGRGGAPTRGRLSDYLNSVRERFTDYEELLVLDPQARVVATSGQQVQAPRLPADWARQLSAEMATVGEAYWNTERGHSELVVAVPVQRPDGRILGALAARLNLQGAQDVLTTFVQDTAHRIYVVTTDGALVIGSQGISAELMQAGLPAEALAGLTSGQQSALDYTSYDGRAVAGSLKPITRTRWSAVAEINEATAYRQVRQFRNRTLMLISVFLLMVGGLAYYLGLLLVRPLDRLIKGAAEVAAGDLTVDLPVVDYGAGEVGYLTYVFNHMVARIREGRKELDAINERLRKQNEELERLSITDSLTGLSNRRHLMQRLNEEMLRARRHDRTFAVLMADVDHFKAYNDTFGHPAGDDVLRKMATILRESTRIVDCVARYGGEEFAVLLPEATGELAGQVAERIRARVAEEKFTHRKITLSVGIASFPEHGDSVEAVIARADEALYRAKRAGRNRALRAEKVG
ncbi:MAG: diguanylate cyclase [Gemmatimonadetes bacterium]|nr:diguanylate cyclase [Gemmatimonadota bacterium]